MNIHWQNVFIALFLIALLLLLAMEGRSITAFLGSWRHFGPGYPPDERFVGMLAFGLIGVLIVAITKLLTRPRK